MNFHVVIVIKAKQRFTCNADVDGTRKWTLRFLRSPPDGGERFSKGLSLGGTVGQV